MSHSIFPSIISTPEPPYYAVIFTSVLREGLAEEHAHLTQKMLAMVSEQPGFLGMESYRDPDDGAGVTISYWQDQDSIEAWSRNPDHQEVAQAQGADAFYHCYQVRICKIERDRTFLREALDAL